MTVNIYNLDAGDTKFEPGNRVTLDSDGTGSAGDLVKFDGSGQVTPTTANGDNWVGVLHQTPDHAGQGVTVIVGGVAIVTTDTAVSPGNLVVPSGTTDGRVEAVPGTAAGLYQSVDEGGTATYNLALRHPQALTDPGAQGDLMAVKLPG